MTDKTQNDNQADPKSATAQQLQDDALDTVAGGAIRSADPDDGGEVTSSKTKRR